MVVDGSAVHLGPGRDIAQRNSIEAMLGEQPDCCFEYSVTGTALNLALCNSAHPSLSVTGSVAGAVQGTQVQEIRYAGASVVGCLERRLRLKPLVPSCDVWILILPNSRQAEIVHPVDARHDEDVSERE